MGEDLFGSADCDGLSDKDCLSLLDEEMAELTDKNRLALLKGACEDGSEFLVGEAELVSREAVHSIPRGYSGISGPVNENGEIVGRHPQDTEGTVEDLKSSSSWS